MRSYLFYSHLFVFLAMVSLFFWSAWPCPAAAEETLTLSPILVTARSADHEHRTGDVDTDITPGFYHDINRVAFEGKFEDLSEVIENHAGVQVRQSGGLGGFSTVSLRGASADQVMVYLDGVLLNDGAGGGMDLSNVSLSDVHSIEIFRGVSPIHFDQASIGGVVNIRTIQPRPGLQSNLSAGYGSFNTKKIEGFLSHRPEKWDGKWDYLISGDYLASDNDFRFKNDNGTPVNPQDDHWENRRNAQMDQVNLLARLGRDSSSGSRLDVIHKYFSKDQGLPSWNNSRETETDFSIDQNISTLKWVADDVSAFHLNTCSQVDYLFKTEIYDDAKGHVGLGKQKNEYKTRRLSGKTFLEYSGKNHLLQCRLGASRETYTAEDTLSRETITQSRRISAIAGMQDTVFLMDQCLQITPGLRFQQVTDDLTKAVDDKGSPVAPEQLNDQYLMPQMGVRCQMNPDIILKSNISKYYRIPSFYELFGDRGIFLGNPDLRPEKGMNADAGVEFRKQLDCPFLDNFSGYGAVFASRIDDMITRTYDARGIGKSDNISEADIYGVECCLTVDINSYAALTGQYTWQETENKSPVKAFSGNRLPGKFEHSWLAKAQFWSGDLSLTLSYVYEDDMYYDTANLLPATAKTEINADLSWMWKDVRITMAAKNIGNENYEDFNGYPQPGRSYFCSVRYSL